MFDHGLEYLKKLLPEFQKKPKPEPRPAAAAQTSAAAAKPASQSPPGPPERSPQSTPSNANPVEMLDGLTDFLRQYLVCDQHQLNVLALWIIHTWCYQHFPTATYLNICSAEPQCGKTRCLELLSLFSDSPWLATGVLRKTILDKLLTPERSQNLADGAPFPAPRTVLLDDCHHTFGPSERQPHLALLNTGSRKTGRYVFGSSEYCLFGPKAFASNAPLLPSLASRCIPIPLRRKKPSDSVRRFDRRIAAGQAAKLLDWLNAISARPGWIAKKANEAPPGLPKRLTPREQDCAEPLIHIADAIGGTWPETARNSVDMIFKLSPGTVAAELLHDLRVIFMFKKDPEYLASRDILELLASLEFRPWNSWSRNSGKKLAGLLGPLGIRSQNLHCNSEKSFKGYLFKDFQDAWQRYAPVAEADAES
ncbi:MAG TPA: DUF3631 domain-containing protein [Candidatus Angelobacter sp.]